MTVGEDPVVLAIERLGLGDVRPDLDGLRRVYRSWCRNILFDSSRKRIFQADGAHGPLPGARPETFFDQWLRDGSGGSCWSTSLALHALCVRLGFAARLAVGTMQTDPNVTPNHGTVLVRTEGLHLVDSSMLFEEPLELHPVIGTNRDDPLHPVSARPCEVDGRQSWMIRWRPAHTDRFVDCLVESREVSMSEWDALHERTRDYSLFNAALYVRRNTASAILAFGRGRLVRRNPDGSLTRRAVPATAVPDLLRSSFGFSDELIAALPSDDDGPAFF